MPLPNIPYIGNIVHKDGLDYVTDTIVNQNESKTIAINGFYTFNGNDYLKIPDSLYVTAELKDLNVSALGAGAFSYCNYLTEIEIPLFSTEPVFFGSNLFTNNPKLKKIYFLGTVEDWCGGDIKFKNTSSSPMTSANAFYISRTNKPEVKIKLNTVNLSKVPNNFEITSFAFSHFKSLSGLILNTDKIDKIGESAFYGCQNITDIYVTCSQSEWETYRNSDKVVKLGNDILFTDYSVVDTPIEANLKYYYIYDEDSNAYKKTTDIEIVSGQTYYTFNKFFRVENPKKIGLPSYYVYNEITHRYELTTDTEINDSTAYYAVDLERRDIIWHFNYIEFEGQTGTFSDNYFTYTLHSYNDEIFVDDYPYVSVSGFSKVSREECEIPSILNGVYENNEHKGEYYAFAGEPVFSIDSSAFHDDETIVKLTLTDTKVIGDYAFVGCTNLKDIQLPDDIKIIGAGAFDNTKLSDIANWDSSKLIFDNKYLIKMSNPTSPSTVDINAGGKQIYTIADFAANDNYNLTGITFGDTLEYIGSDAFADCVNLKTVTFNNGLKYIGISAFENCKSLTSLSIPNTVELIDVHAFRNCGNLISINVTNQILDSRYYSINNCLIDRTNNVLILGCKNSKLDSTIENIGEYAFSGCKELVISDTGFNFNTNLMYIGRSAFLGCEGFTSINIPHCTRGIDEYAFKDCINLTTVTLGTDMNLIGYGAFEGCNNLESITLPFIGASVDSQNETAVFGAIFGYTEELDSDNIVYKYNVPESLKTVEILDGITNIPNGAFKDCTNIESIILPKTITSIGDFAFENCKNLKSIVIPDSVISIGENAFKGCNRLNSITLPFIGRNKTDLMTFGAIFGEATDASDINRVTQNGITYNIPLSIKEVIISDGCTTIPPYAFENCEFISSITIATTVRQVYDTSFNGFDLNPTNQTNMSDPEDLSLFKLYTDVSGVKYLVDRTNLDNLKYYLLYPTNSFTATSYTVLSNTVSVCENAFKDYTTLTSLLFNTDLKYICDSAFYGCSFTTIAIPSSVTYVGNGAFDEILTLDTLNIYDLSAYCSITFGGIPFNSETHHTHEIYIYDESAGLYVPLVNNALSLPDTITNLPLGVFSNTSNIESFTASVNLNTISDYAFYNCTNLTIVNLLTSLRKIGKSVFEGTALYNNWTSSDNDDLYIGNSLIKVKSTLSDSYTVSDNTVLIANSAFVDSAVEAVEFPDTLLYINDNAFFGVSTLTTLTFNSSLLNIDANAFQGCENISDIYYSSAINWASISFQNSDASPINTNTHMHFTDSDIANLTFANIEKINDFAFCNCSELVTLDIQNVDYVGIRAFYNCTNLSTLSISGESVELALDTFYDDINLSEVNYNIKYISRVKYIDIDSFTNDKFVFNLGKDVKYFPYNLVKPENLLGTTVDTHNKYYDNRNGCNAIIHSASDTLIYGFYNTLLPYSVRYIENRAFSFNTDTSLTDINLSSHLIQIGNRSFMNNDEIPQIRLPKHIEFVGEDAFKSCSSIDKIYYNAGELEIGGYSATTTPFSSLTDLSSVRFGFTVENIPAYLFYNNSNLSNIEMLSYTIYHIGRYAIKGTAFYNNDDNWSDFINKQVNPPVSYAKTLLYLGRYLIESRLNSTNLADIRFNTSNDLVAFADYAFEGHINLSAVNVYSESLLGIGDYTFSGCTNLSSFNGGNLDSVKYIGEYAFSGCIKLNSFTIPISVKVIHPHTFDSCSSLTSITINSAIYSIEESAFKNCTGLTSVVDNESISHWMSIDFADKYSNPLYYAKHLKISNDESFVSELTVPDIITKIKNYTFINCKDLADLALHDKITHIGEYAFYGNDSLAEVIIPKSVTYIGKLAFSDCLGLMSISVDSDNAHYCNDENGVLYDKGMTKLIQYPIGNNPTEFEIPDTVDTIYYGAFSSCTHLATVDFPDSLKAINDYAFYNCTSLGGSGNIFEIPDTVESIGAYAFADCTSLEKIQLLRSVTFIDDTAFLSNNSENGKLNVTIRCYNNSYAHRYAIRNNIEFELIDVETPVQPVDPEQDPNLNYCGPKAIWELENGILTIKTHGADTSTTYDYDYSINYLPEFYSSRENITSIQIDSGITTVGNSLFYSLNAVKDTTIPDGVTSIGNWAFEYCTSLTSVTIPDSVTSIGDGAFYECTNLTSVTIPDGVTSIGSYAFYKCSHLTNITIPNSVRVINSYVFARCNSLTSATLSNTATSIGDNAFYYCTRLNRIVIPNTVTYIGTSAFDNCIGLTSVTIGNSVVTISAFAFDHCRGLTHITIPDSVTSIGNFAFSACTGLTGLTFGSGIKSIGDYAFESCTGLTTVVLPNGLTTIGSHAFAYCCSTSRLGTDDHVEIPDSVTKVGSNAFYDVARIYCSNSWFKRMGSPSDNWGARKRHLS